MTSSNDNPKGTDVTGKGNDTTKGAVRRYITQISFEDAITTVPASDYDALASELAGLKADVEQLRQRLVERDSAFEDKQVEVERLKERVEVLTRERDHWREQHDFGVTVLRMRDDALGAAESQLAAARLNERRYLWLRMALFQRDPALSVGEASIYMKVYGMCPDVTDIDTSIDAAIEATPKEGRIGEGGK